MGLCFIDLNIHGVELHWMKWILRLGFFLMMILELFPLGILVFEET